MNNIEHHTNIIYELPDEENKTNSINTTKSPINRNIEVENSNEYYNKFISKTDVRSKEISLINNEKKNCTARINSRHSHDEELYKMKFFPEESEFLTGSNFIDHNDTAVVFEKILNKGVSNVYNEYTFKEAFSFFKNLNFDKEKQTIIVEDISNKKCCEQFHLKITKKHLLHKDFLKQEREIIFCITKLEYNPSNPIHSSLLIQIYSFFTRKNDITCKPIGSHWEKIGFQDLNPKNDFRCVGMFSPLQVLFIIEKYPQLTMGLYEQLQIRKAEWMLFSIFIQFTKITLDLIKDCTLIIFCNQRQSVIETMNLFFCGMIVEFYNSITDSFLDTPQILTAEKVKEIIFTIKKQSTRNPSNVLWKATQIKISYL
jgi:hypothetical protein